MKIVQNNKAVIHRMEITGSLLFVDKKEELNLADKYIMHSLVKRF